MYFCKTKKKSNIKKKVSLGCRVKDLIKVYLKVTFNELCCFNSSLHIEADVHLHLSFMVCKLDNWHLRTGEPEF